MAYAVFDVETRVDKALLNRVYHPGEGLSDHDAYQRHRAELKRRRGSDFFPITLHVPISVAVGMVGDDHVLRSVESLAHDEYSEEKLVREFWARADRFSGTLVTFNGRRFDLPVLELAALRHGIAAPHYFAESSNVRKRYADDRHLDLLDFISNYGAIPLSGGMNLLLKMIGMPGKTGVEGSMVQELFEAGRLDDIHRYCRDDVAQTYFLFLRVELMRGRIDEAKYRAAFDASKSFLGAAAEVQPQ
ncbi:MAG: 3'-5' exonuclease [Candidatus Binataceae bacterium]